jgi:hypothetical protein
MQLLFKVHTMHAFHAMLFNSVPSAPLDVLAEPYYLDGIRVSWLTPAEPNSNPLFLIYNISWLTVNADGTQSEKTRQVDPRGPDAKGRMNSDINGLEPGHGYKFRASYY